ncbi:MAG: M48 family metallopeptidase [Cyanobacteria bacterium J06632_22]
MNKLLRFCLVALMSCALVLVNTYSWASVGATITRSQPLVAQAEWPEDAAEQLPDADEVPDADSSDVAETDMDGTEADADAGNPGEGDVAGDESEAFVSEEYDPEEWFQRELLIEADRLYQAGQIAQAEALYREAKTYGWRDDEDLSAAIPPEPFTDEAQLSAGAAVYWRESARGIEAGRESQALVPLKLLTEEYPSFIPAHARYAELLISYDRAEAAEVVLENALTQYPSHPDLLRAQVALMMQEEQWIEASISSRQFALLNSEHPEAEAYDGLADENLERFKTKTNQQIRNNAIANVITGIAGYALTGGLFGPFTALSSTMALLQGEKALGEQIAVQVREQLPMIEDDAVFNYINDMGQELAAVAGRDEFDYEFHVIVDEEINAFALPGGKIFVNAGAILATQSEAEIAGLLAHEISHAVLSHGFQRVTQGNLTASITQYLPLPSLVTNALVSSYSRQMERQADIVGTQILAASGYAADGMHGLMLALNDRYGDLQRGPAWLSTHPAPQERVDYLQVLVERGGYNRYAYEGVASHEAIQALTLAELETYKAQEKLGEDEETPADSVEDAVEEVQQEQQEAEVADAEADTTDAVGE